MYEYDAGLSRSIMTAAAPRCTLTYMPMPKTGAMRGITMNMDASARCIIWCDNKAVLQGFFGH